MVKAISDCPCCGGEEFEKQKILWPELIKQWSLAKKEVAYINRQ